MASSPPKSDRWYAEVGRYEWLVLAIASAGWIFDTFEGQVFNITRNQMLAEILGVDPGSGEIRRWGDAFLAIFLAGGTAGGILFGTLADRFGRRPIMAATILMYSAFSGLTYFATELWHVAVLRFLVALGVGGEWAVAAALVAEVFPPRARARAAGIFHSTSLLGTWLAAGAGLLVGSQWRYAYVLGVAPALLVLWVRASVHEPESWKRANREGKDLGSFRELFGGRGWTARAIFGILLAGVGMGVFWGVAVAGQDLVQDFLTRRGVAPGLASERAKVAYGFVQATGAGLGLLAFGPISERLGRRPTFALMFLGAMLIVPITCYGPQTYGQLLAILPVFGFFTLAVHAGFAVYFPELFPGHLRATGAGVCYNGGRLLAAPILYFSGVLKALPGLDLRMALSLLGLLSGLGLVVLLFLPETKGRPLPE